MQDRWWSLKTSKEARGKCSCVTYFQFRGTTFHLVLVPFVSLCQRYRTPYLLTFCNLKLLILSDVI